MKKLRGAGGFPMVGIFFQTFVSEEEGVFNVFLKENNKLLEMYHNLEHEFERYPHWGSQFCLQLCIEVCCNEVPDDLSWQWGYLPLIK